MTEQAGFTDADFVLSLQSLDLEDDSQTGVIVDSCSSCYLLSC
ncbi:MULTISPECIES: hypothetical protein [unclassified Streptomyces]